MSFGEMVILGIIALVVVGPRRLPSMLRTAGQVIGKVRRMAMDIRAESGIDEILDAEGIRSEIDNFRRLATGEIVLDEPKRNVLPDREREYPRVGADAYGALSEDIIPYSPAPPVDALPATSDAAGAPEGGTNGLATAAATGEGGLAPNGEGGLAPTGAEVKS